MCTVYSVIGCREKLCRATYCSSALCDDLDFTNKILLITFEFFLILRLFSIVVIISIFPSSLFSNGFLKHCSLLSIWDGKTHTPRQSLVSWPQRHSVKNRIFWFLIWTLNSQDKSYRVIMSYVCFFLKLYFTSKNWTSDIYIGTI